MNASNGLSRPERGPPGRLYQLRGSFDRLGQTLRSVLSELGIDPGEPEVLELHNVIEGVKFSTAEV
jgi:hypothetical protein